MCLRTWRETLSRLFLMASAAAATATAAAASNNRDDHDYPKLQVGEMLDERYKVEGELGRGTYGVVVLAEDTGDTSAGVARVAIKISRSTGSYAKCTIREFEILSSLAGQANVVRASGTFMHGKHACIVLEHLGESLIHMRRFYPPAFWAASPVRLASVARQLGEMLSAFGAAQVAHCDLSPTNLLLPITATVTTSATLAPTLHVVDFGMAMCGADVTHARLVGRRQTLEYRAPEVLLGLSYGAPVDMWSCGALLVEILTGQILFPIAWDHNPAQDETQPAFVAGRIALYAEALGMPPPHISVLLPALTLSRRSMTRNPKRGGILAQHIGRALASSTAADHLLHLVLRMLEWDPRQRITPVELLQHPFVQLAVTAKAT
jgi:serine/threonine protein kinase